MTHPNPEKNKAQAEYLAQCKPQDRRFHELMFMVGNATYRYHQLAKTFHPTEDLWKEWLEGLEEPIKTGMRTIGFEKGQSILSFTRYVNEKNDLGLEEYIKEHINEKDFQEYKDLLGESK